MVVADFRKKGHLRHTAMIQIWQFEIYILLEICTTRSMLQTGMLYRWNPTHKQSTQVRSGIISASARIWVSHFKHSVALTNCPHWWSNNRVVYQYQHLRSCPKPAVNLIETDFVRYCNLHSESHCWLLLLRQYREPFSVHTIYAIYSSGQLRTTQFINMLWSWSLN